MSEPMTTLASGNEQCLGLYVLVSFGMAALIFVNSPPAEPWPYRAGSAGMEGLLVGLVATMVMGGLDGTRTRMKERRALTRRGDR